MIVRVLLFLGVVAMPFSAVSGIRALGELSPELSIYFLLPAVVAALFSKVFQAATTDTTRSRSSLGLLLMILTATMGVLLVSFLANAATIAVVSTHGRQGIEKFLGSSGVVLFFLGLAYVSFFDLATDWRGLLLRPITVSVVLCLTFSVFEILARKLGVATGIYEVLDSIVHSGWNPEVYKNGWDSRLRSVAFEAPDFGNYVGFVWPWLIAGWMGSTGNARRGYFVVWILLTALELFSPSRTALVMLAGSALVLLLLHNVYLPGRRGASVYMPKALVLVSVVALGIAAAVIGIAMLENLQSEAIASASETNVTRLAYIQAAIEMFKDQPLFGVGFGQFAFHVDNYLPSWARFSSEVTYWTSFTQPLKYWPTSYNIYARLACELGILGLIWWIGLWLGLAWQIFSTSLKMQKIQGAVPAAAYPLVAGCFCVLLSGSTTDTFRQPMIWITLGLSCRFLADARGLIGQRQKVRRARLDFASAKRDASSPLFLNA